ncbi:MAG: beta-propeller fold lactonase family protein [Terracidiphilus sp.]
MKFSKPSQLVLVSTIGLLAAILVTACQIVTIDDLYLASSAGSGNSSGLIDTFAVDSETGALRPAYSPVSSGGNSPVSLAVTSNYQNLYVANQASNNIVHFSIATSGELSKQDAVTLSSEGTVPVAIAVNNAGTRLYVVSADLPGNDPGAVLAAFSLSSSGAIGSPIKNGTLDYWPLVVPGYADDLIVPTGVVATVNNNAVYVTAYDQSAYNPGGTATSTANPGWVFGFGASSGGGLSAAPGSPYRAGVKPTGVVADPTNRFVYVTDYASNELIGYSIEAGYELEFLLNGPFKTGNEPQAVTIDQRGLYIYVANALDSTVSAYEIALPTGTPSAAINVTGSASNSTDAQPDAITVDASLGRFVFTANHLGDSISGFQLNPNTGALTPTLNTPYPSSASPTAIITVPHGSHSTESVTP